MYYGACMGKQLIGGLLQSQVGPTVVIVSPYSYLLMLLVPTNLIASSLLLEAHTMPSVGPGAIIFISRGEV